MKFNRMDLKLQVNIDENQTALKTLISFAMDFFFFFSTKVAEMVSLSHVSINSFYALNGVIRVGGLRGHHPQ